MGVVHDGRVWIALVGVDRDERVELALRGAGLTLGTFRDGSPAVVRLFRRLPLRTGVFLPRHCVEPLVLRILGAGATVHVRSPQPRSWAALMRAAGIDPGRLVIGLPGGAIPPAGGPLAPVVVVDDFPGGSGGPRADLGAWQTGLSLFPRVPDLSGDSVAALRRYDALLVPRLTPAAARSLGTGTRSDVRDARLAKIEESQTGEKSQKTNDESFRDDDLDDDGVVDNPNLDDDGYVKDPEADGDDNGVQDGDQYVEGDADLNDDGQLSTFEREYGDKDDDGRLDNRDDAEGNDLEVDDTPGVDPTDHDRDGDGVDDRYAPEHLGHGEAVLEDKVFEPVREQSEQPTILDGIAEFGEDVEEFFDGLGADQDMDGRPDDQDGKVEFVDKDGNGVHDNLQDSDGDGYSDELENFAGSDPNDASR